MGGCGRVKKKLTQTEQKTYFLHSMNIQSWQFQRFPLTMKFGNMADMLLLNDINTSAFVAQQNKLQQISNKKAYTKKHN